MSRLAARLPLLLFAPSIFPAASATAQSTPSVLVVKVRKALLYYALKRLGLDTDPSARKPQDQQIVLLNREIFVPVVAEEELEGLECSD